jgi:uncharacterized membrane protein (DUF373 family)
MVNPTALNDGVAHVPERGRNHTPRKVLEWVQDIIVLVLGAALFIAMLTKLGHLGRLLWLGTDFQEVMANILFVLVLIELFRLLIIYLDEHRISVSTMVEVGIVSTLREVILHGPLQIDWRQMLVVSFFVLTLALVLRYGGFQREGEFHNRKKNRFRRGGQRTFKARGAEIGR